MHIGTDTPPPLANHYPKKFLHFFKLFFHFRCILLQISHKKCFFISISILGRSGVKDTLQRIKQSRTTAQFILNNRIITDLDEIANEFNAYFVGIGQLLSEQIHSDSSSQEYLIQRNKPPQ